MRRQLGSVTAAGKGRWRVAISSGYDLVNHKRIRESKVVRGTRKEAENALALMLVKSGQVSGSTMTLDQYMTVMYLPHVREKVREMTSGDYERKYNTHVKAAFGDKPLAKLDPYSLDAWLRDKGRSAPNIYRVLHAALGQAVRWRLIPYNPLASVEVPKVTRDAPDVLNAAECRRYLETFRGHRIEPVILLAIGAGLRRSELAGLMWGDVGFAEGTVTVSSGMHQRSGKVWREPPKTAKSARTLYLPTWCASRLKELRGIGPLVPITPNAISSAYTKHLKAVEGLRYVPLKNLRHTHLTQLVESGVPIYDVSRRAGHSNTVITQSTYLNPDTAAADEKAARALDGLA